MKPGSTFFRKIPSFSVLLLIFTTFNVLFAGGVTGTQECLYTVSDPIASYRNAGYQLSCDDTGQVVVSISAMPIRYAAQYPGVQPGPEMDEYLATDFQLPPHQLPPRLKQRLKRTHGYWYAVSIVLSWVSDHFTYGEQGLGPYSGNCNTAARTTVQLLRLAGIPAREAVGVLMDREHKTLAGTSLHRFVEVYYPDLGWLYSDPLSAHHYVPASYVRLDETQLDRLLGLTIDRKKPLPPLQPVGILDENPVPSRINLLRFF